MAKGKKTGGRRPGSPNKENRAVKERLALIVSEYYNSKLFEEDLEQLEPRERVTLMEKLTNYSVPKMQATSVDATIEGKKTIEDKLASLAGGGE